MPAIRIDGRPIVVEDGCTVLDAARAAGIPIPTLCHRDGCAPSAYCMVCAVRIEGRAGWQPACSTPVAEGQSIETDSSKIRAARQSAIELILSDHVGDCVAPCQWACPAGLFVPGLLRRLAGTDTATIVPDAVPCRDCPAPCERACRRARFGGAVSIRRLALALVPAFAPMPDQRAPRDFSVHMGALSDAEAERFRQGASPEPRIEPADPAAGFSADEAQREAGRCLHCDCRKADHCRLRDRAREQGAHPGAWRGPRRAFEQDASHPSILYESGKCIACGVCVQIAATAGEPVGLTFVGRGFGMRMAPALGKPLSEALTLCASACAEACPTGALVMK